VAPDTGLPYDSSLKSPYTSVSNIGMYLTDVLGALSLELISRNEAIERIGQTLESLEQLETDFGFQQSWNAVQTLKPSPDDPWISILDSGNLAAGLITVGAALPVFRERCDRLVNAMDWGAFYDARRHVLQGGYNRVTKAFNPDWTLPLLGTDSRLAVFLLVASGDAPVTAWERLDRGTEVRHYARYLKPGWQGGGLFMQFINGIWLDEAGTLMGQSAENFAYAQIRQAQLGHYPVWGWSACEDPAGGYLGWGHLRDEVVTPHASVLAIEAYPHEVLENLRQLEKMGVRHPEWGFYDSVDIKTGRHAETFLLLDQSMLFLSLVNYLKNDPIRTWFQSAPLIRHGRALIPDFARPLFGDDNAMLTLEAPAP